MPEKPFTWVPHEKLLSYEDMFEFIKVAVDEGVKKVRLTGGEPLLRHGLEHFVKMIADYAPNLDLCLTTNAFLLEEAAQKLKNAGLEMMPGGGAEILNSRIHDALFPEKIGHERWLEIVRAVHRAGIKTNATMLYGHIETIEERVDHLITLRKLQDETGGFSAFIPLAFHSQNTQLSHIPPTTAVDVLKNVAAARLILDNFDHIKAYWVMIGERLAQVALSFGADDLDGTIIEERITHTAGATSAKGLTKKQMEDMILQAGFEPVERDSFYHPVNSLKE